jgi:hypothetical protein
MRLLPKRNIPFATFQTSKLGLSRNFETGKLGQIASQATVNMFKPRSVKTRLVLVGFGVGFGYGNLALALFRISGVASDSAWKKRKGAKTGARRLSPIMKPEARGYRLLKPLIQKCSISASTK